MELLLIGLAVGTYLYFNQAKEFIKSYKLSNLKAKLNNKKSLETGYKYVYLDLSVDVVNPTEFAGKLKGGFLNVYYQTRYIGKILFDKEIAITPKATTLAQVPAVIESIKIFSSAKEAVRQLFDGNGITIHVAGQLEFAIGVQKIDTDVKVI